LTDFTPELYEETPEVPTQYVHALAAPAVHQRRQLTRLDVLAWLLPQMIANIELRG
jgi:hypothetical protein